MTSDAFFDTWGGLVRVVVIAPAAYAALVLFLRISGKRTLSKLNVFDLVVTVALGSTLATILLSSDVALAEGLLALTMLILLRYVVTWSSVGSSRINSIVKSEPALLVRHGRQLGEPMRLARLVEAEIAAAVRQEGFASISEVEAVILETDGSLSVIGSRSERLPPSPGVDLCRRKP